MDDVNKEIQTMLDVTFKGVRSEVIALATCCCTLEDVAGTDVRLMLQWDMIQTMIVATMQANSITPEELTEGMHATRRAELNAKQLISLERDNDLILAQTPEREAVVKKRVADMLKGK